jgi:5-methylcytosine-specific restriction endonuclease McrA
MLQNRMNSDVAIPSVLAPLTNDELLASLRACMSAEREALARIIRHLQVVEERRLHLELACSSMFELCTRKLGMSEGAAFRRINAARLARRFPQVVDAIASGRVSLSNAVEIRDRFTAENVAALLDEIAGKTKLQVRELAARLAPRPDVPAKIRKLPENRTAHGPEAAAGPVSAQTRPHADRGPVPLSEGRYQFRFTASAAFREKVERAQNLLRHRVPDGDLAALLERSLDALIVQLEKEREAKVDRPRPSQRPPTDPSRVSRAARREVVARDGSQCTFVSAAGERCQARGGLEVDHRVPRACGGTGDVANLRLLCRPHNRLEAERRFGREHVARKIHEQWSEPRADSGAGVAADQAHLRQHTCSPGDVAVGQRRGPELRDASPRPAAVAARPEKLAR